MHFDVTCETECGEVELMVEVEYRPGCEARLSGHPDNWEPAEPSEVCLIQVTAYGSGKVVPFDKLPEDFPGDEDLARLADAAYADAEDAARTDALIEAHEARYDIWA